MPIVLLLSAGPAAEKGDPKIALIVLYFSCLPRWGGIPLYTGLCQRTRFIRSVLMTSAVGVALSRCRAQ